MKIPQDIFSLIKRFHQLKKKANRSEYDAIIKDYMSYEKNPWFSYQRISPKKDEVLVSFHNHSDGYTFFDLAETASQRGYKFFGISNHSSDSQFDGRRILYSKDHDIFLLRGMECRCQEKAIGTEDYWSMDELKFKTRKKLGDETDILFIGYEGYIDTFQPFEETTKKARAKNKALVQLTSPLNRILKGPSEKNIEAVLKNVDAIEVFDSNNTSYACCYDVMATKYAKQIKKPQVYANDAHTLREIGCAGVGFRKEDFEKFLKDPNWTINHVDDLLETIRNSLNSGKYNNYGFHVPRFSIVYPDKILALARDMIQRPFDKDKGEWMYSTDARL
jgi:hypothetical protein